MRVAPALVAGLALLLLVLPSALADHVFSHRVYVTGRVVDADGRPIPGEPVEVAFAGLAPSGRCVTLISESTSETGDFSVCRHAHVVPANVTVTVSVGGANATAPVDPALRSAALLVQTPERRARGSIQGDHAFNTTFHVEGRAFALFAVPTEVEGVEVEAAPRAGRNVTVSLGDASAVAKVDEWGNYAADLDVAAVPPGMRVYATLDDGGWSAAPSALFRRANVDVVHAAPPPDVPRPGGDVPGVGAWGAVAAAGLALAARRRAG